MGLSRCMHGTCQTRAWDSQGACMGPASLLHGTLKMHASCIQDSLKDLASSSCMDLTRWCFTFMYDPCKESCMDHVSASHDSWLYLENLTFKILAMISSRDHILPPHPCNEVSPSLYRQTHTAGYYPVPNSEDVWEVYVHHVLLRFLKEVNCMGVQPMGYRTTSV